jgi:hypothetical protein
LHFTQKIQIINEETLEGILELDMEINQELESFILKYTDQLSVIQPFTFKNKVYEKLRIALKNYQ